MTARQHDIAALVRTADPDRYLAALFAPAEKRPRLLTLYAFNIEVARVAEAVRQPMLGEIRLAWWRETLEGARAGKPRSHPVAVALADLFANATLPERLFDEMLDARIFDSSTALFADRAALERYCDATSGNLMRLAATILGTAGDTLAHHAGIAYAIAGILRSIPHNAARRKCFLPETVLANANLSTELLFAGQERDRLKAAVAEMAGWANEHLRNARVHRLQRQTAAAYLPAAVTPLYLRRLTRPWFDPFVHPVEVPIHRRQLRLLSAAMRRRL